MSYRKLIQFVIVMVAVAWLDSMDVSALLIQSIGNQGVGNDIAIICRWTKSAILAALPYVGESAVDYLEFRFKYDESLRSQAPYIGFADPVATIPRTSPPNDVGTLVPVHPVAESVYIICDLINYGNDTVQNVSINGVRLKEAHLDKNERARVSFRIDRNVRETTVKVTAQNPRNEEFYASYKLVHNQSTREAKLKLTRSFHKND